MAARRADPLAILDRVVACLRQRRAVHMIIGAWALGPLGKPRATMDVDFLVMSEGKELERVAAALERRGMRRDVEWADANPALRCRQMRLECEGVIVDLLAPRDAHDLEALARRRRRRVRARLHWFPTAEDFILQKLKVGRPRDFEDAAGVLERSGADIDRAYLWKWARALGITEELGYVLS